MMLLEIIQAAQSLPAVLPFEHTASLWRAGLSRQKTEIEHEIGQGAGLEPTVPVTGGKQRLERGVFLPRYSGNIIH